MLGSAYCWRSYLRAMAHFGALCAADVVIGALGIYLWARRSFGATIYYSYWPLRVNAVDTSEVAPGTRRRALLLELSGASRAICIGQAPFACPILRARRCAPIDSRWADVAPGLGRLLRDAACVVYKYP